MKFQQVCDELGIGKYAKRIFHSNSHGELHFIYEYFDILYYFKKDGVLEPWFAEWFPKWVDGIVEWAEREWVRPESIFQHIPNQMWELLKVEGE